MNSNQLRRWLISRGCTVQSKPGGGGHKVVRRGNFITDLPTHGGSKQVGKGLIRKVLKELGIDEAPPN